MLTQSIWNKYPFLEKNKIIILFILKALCIYFFLLFCYFGYVGLVDPQGSFNLSNTLGKFNLIEITTQGLIYPTKFLLGLFGYQTTSFENQVAIIGAPGIRIAFPCLGIKTWISFTALILAYPSARSFSSKLLYIAFGIFIFHCVNIMRMTILTWVNKDPSLHYAFDFHHDAFNLVVYLIIFLMFYLWIKDASGTKLKV